MSCSCEFYDAAKGRSGASPARIVGILRRLIKDKLGPGGGKSRISAAMAMGLIVRTHKGWYRMPKPVCDRHLMLAMNLHAKGNK